VPVGGDVHLEMAEFRLFRELFNAHCGILFGTESKPILERRLRDRIAALGLHSFSEYYQLLRYDDRGHAELDEATDLITINETYFFRETYQLRAYREEILPRLHAGPGGRERLSVWSAGCASGEEVYSVAMLTREAGLFPTRSVRVFGSDISRRCVIAARRGVYGPSSFRATPPEIRRRYFHERPDGMHVVEELRALCQFGQLNLLDAARSSVVGRVDVIFCRNVMIYFDEDSRRRVIEMFYDRLLPGGFLLLGHSESLLNISTAFELVHLREDLVYRKPITATRLASSFHPVPSELRGSLPTLTSLNGSSAGTRVSAPHPVPSELRVSLPPLVPLESSSPGARSGAAARPARTNETPLAPAGGALPSRTPAAKPTPLPGTDGDKR